jgi:hypothetical protein
MHTPDKLVADRLEIAAPPRRALHEIHTVEFNAQASSGLVSKPMEDYSPVTGEGDSSTFVRVIMSHVVASRQFAGSATVLLSNREQGELSQGQHP